MSILFRDVGMGVFFFEAGEHDLVECVLIYLPRKRKLQVTTAIPTHFK